MHSATQWKFRHLGVDEAGRKCLLWASDGPGRSEDFKPGEVLVGSPAYADIVNGALWTPNALADEGEADILDVYFDTQAVRSNLYGRLYDDTPVETDTLTTLTGEVSGSGYAAVTFARGTDWGAPGLDSGDMQTDSTTKTFTATGTWSSATYIVLATVASGTSGLLIAYVALSATRTLSSGQDLDVSFGVKLA